jgi:serine protease AprX
MTVHTHERPEPGGRRSAIRWRGAACLAGSLLGFGAAATTASAAPALGPVPQSSTTAIVLVTEPGTAPRSVIAAVGGEVTRSLPLVHGVAARIPSGALSHMRELDGVRTAVADRHFQPRGEAPADAAVDADAGLSLRQVRTVIGADRLAPVAPDADRVDVAVVDTGVAPVAGLAGEKLVNSPDFSADRNVEGQQYLDSFGHGTHMAGIVGANDPATKFAGVAPESRIVNVRVADHAGDTSLSQLLAGIDWTVRNRNRGDLNIRVMNLAFGAQVDGSYRTDPLAYAVEQAWQKGIVVVTAAGNAGAEATGLDSPAYDPYVVAVGANDTVGTETLADDLLAEFSSIGKAERTPDVVAPGVGIVSLRVAGGFLDTAFPAARIGESWFRGSGTSQAAAVVSGAAALLLDRRPDLDPDEVKALLRATARPLAGVDVRGQGAGVIDLAAAATAPVGGKVTQSWPRANGSGAFRARGMLGLQLAVEEGHGEDWSSRRWSSRRWSSRRWSAEEWASRRWSAEEWASRRWSAEEWASRRWSADDWASRRWSADDWASRRWSADDWASRRWSGFAWEAPAS